MDKTGRALVEHWQWAAVKGLMNTTTARLIRTACLQVLNAQENWENLDIEELDADEAFRRFQNLNAKNLTPQSLKDYKRRFSQGVQSFLDYLRAPANWKGPVTEKPPRKAEVQEKSSMGSRRIDKAKNSTVRTSTTNNDREALIEYPFPIRESLTARLALPGDLTVSEARRLANFVASLAIDAAPGAKTA